MIDLTKQNEIKRFLGSPVMIPVGIMIGIGLMVVYTKYIKK